MTTPHDKITTSPEYAHWYQHYTAQGDTSEDAARNAYAVTTEAIAKRKRTTNRTLAIVAAIVGLIGTTAAVAIVLGPNPAPTPPRTVTGQQSPAEEPPPPPPSPARYTPVATDFTLAPKITEKQCFGEAGCVVTFRVEVTYGGLPLAEEDEWLVTYTVAGVKDGPHINSFTIRGTEVHYDGSEIVQTSSTSSALKVTVTAVGPN